MGHGHAKTLPADLSAPSFVRGWQARSLVVAVLFTVTAVVLATLDHSAEHLYRAWVVGLMLCFGFSVCWLALLMVQHVTGGKWGLLLRRPLEAMTRTLPLVFVYWIVTGLWMKKLYLWARFSDAAAALKAGLINETEAHAIEWKRPMLNPEAFWIVGIVCFAIWAFYTWKLNSWSLQRDADGASATAYWIRKFDNFSGFGIVVYALTMTAAVIYWVMSMDVTWYSSVYGLLFLVGEGYQVLALSVLTTLSLSKAEPIRTMLRKTEQYDLGKFMMAFVMLNIYLAFAQFLIIWSGNLPEEIVWYMNRINGHWGIFLTMDFIFHWLIPFSLLLSRDIKTNKKRLMRVAQWMIFAKAFDLFVLVEPNFKDAAGNLHFSWGILEYIAVPVAMVSLWLAYYGWELTRRPLVQTNDPHLAEILEPEHAHA